MSDDNTLSDETHSVGDIVVVSRDSFANNFIAKVFKVNFVKNNPFSCIVEFRDGVREEVQNYAIRKATLKEKEAWNLAMEKEFARVLDQMLSTMENNKKLDLIATICNSMKTL